LKSKAQISRKYQYFLALVLVVLLSSAGRATVFYTQKTAFALAFPEATRVDSQTFIVTEEQAEEIERAGRSELPTRLVTIHRGWKDETLLGYAHIDVHTVRTKPEALLVVLSPDAEVMDTRVLAFHEPLEFMPAGSWYQNFVGRGWNSDLRVGFDVDAVTGATLTTWATVDSVRRMLAYYTTLLQPD
jgi:transcriptional regulator of nitric oxide reductase